jgi:hypothetical protein
MSYPIHYVPAGDVLPIMFSTYDGGTGASLTMSGLAVTDIEIYKDGSVTQRSSDAGYTLLDTDGIDFDGLTGIHGFSIDTGDNTDAGFYTVGAWFHVVVSAVTVDAQTVSFIAAAFRLMPAESVAGKPKVDVDAWLGTAAATPTVAGVPEVDVTHFGGSAGTFASGRPEANVNSIAANAVNASALATDAVTEIQSGLATAAALDTVDNFLDTEVAAILAAVDTEVAAIKAVTDLLPDAGALTSLATQASINDLPTNAELATALGTADDAVLAAIAALNNLSAAQVNAEVVDALATDTYAEPGQGSPAATTTLAAKIGYLYKAWRNRSTQTASEYALYGDDAVTKDQEAAVSDNGTTLDRGEVTTGA